VHRADEERKFAGPNRCRQISRANVYRLLETLAEEITAQIITRFEVKRMSLELRKCVLRDAELVSATSVRGQLTGTKRRQSAVGTKEVR